jgi:hypothetical protein
MRSASLRPTVTDSSRENEAIVQVANCLAPGLHEQTRYQGVKHASYAANDHHGAELQCVPLVLPIALSQRSRMNEKEAVKYMGAEGNLVYSWRRNVCFHVAFLAAPAECEKYRMDSDIAVAETSPARDDGFHSGDFSVTERRLALDLDTRTSVAVSASWRAASMS